MDPIIPRILKYFAVIKLIKNVNEQYKEFVNENIPIIFR